MDTDTLATQKQSEHDLHVIPNDPFMRALDRVIKLAVRVLAVLMALLILFGVADVVFEMYQLLNTAPIMILRISDILTLFGAFMAVLIAIEIFTNIAIYLRDDVIHVKIVMATALMAIARKVIVMDYEKTSPEFVYGTAAVVIAMSIGYWLVVKYDPQIALTLKSGEAAKPDAPAKQSP